ncbi:hydrophobic surface binding protein A-domain-containing protein [Talaromyces proteolyticus]|uniref:Cell wall mannoprotein 1 n=1 Tax=Talaromyces proteolyticus TaxID=1131652 RepID=A0AAD4PZ94_9EURO|nr:hydrophobic surface binding protein A-domain-containing protein [Talaromyces proteolyticus]KAH8698786.1 hydrophobic surface binding protein A-domain-containing protein [Talaromyces proteolyticus]
MKFTAAVITLGLATPILATPTLVERTPSLVRRDLTAFTSVLASIDTAVKKFGSDVTSYSGGVPTNLLTDSNDIVSVTNNGVTTLKSQSQLSETDALGLTEPVQGLTSDIQSAINTLISKKSTLVSAGVGGIVEQSLQTQLSGAKQLSSVITSKVPASLQSIASQLSSGITAAIQKGVDAFQGTGTGTATSTGGGNTSPATSVPATSVAGTSTSVSGGSAPSGSSSTAPTPTSSSGSSSPSGVVPGGGSGSSTSTIPAFTGAASSHRVGSVASLAATLFALLPLL